LAVLCGSAQGVDPARRFKWAAALVKWTQPLVTVERIRSATGDMVRQQDKVKASVNAEAPSKN
jgi:hypothetical protein